MKKTEKIKTVRDFLKKTGAITHTELCDKKIFKKKLESLFFIYYCFVYYNHNDLFKRCSEGARTKNT
jgi:hypothetical protein